MSVENFKKKSQLLFFLDLKCPPNLTTSQASLFHACPSDCEIPSSFATDGGCTLGRVNSTADFAPKKQKTSI